jgi:hypothetical protein
VTELRLLVRSEQKPIPSRCLQYTEEALTEALSRVTQERNDTVKLQTQTDSRWLRRWLTGLQGGLEISEQILKEMLGIPVAVEETPPG